MKYIIIGLGNFGSSLATKLADLGHEVIGVDHEIERVEAIKDKITYAICMNCKDPKAAASLPLNETDTVIVCIGEDEASNLMITALFKKMNVKRLISRSINPVHETILEAMDIHEIMRPEEESADRWLNKLTSQNIVDSFDLTDKFSIVNSIVPKKIIGKTVEEIGFTRNYNILVLTTIKQSIEKNIIGISRKKSNVQGIANAKTVFNEGDIMVLFGNKEDIHKLINEIS